MHCNIGENHTISVDILIINVVMKQKQIKYAGFVLQQSIESSIVAGLLCNYCNLLAIMTNNTPIDIRQNRFHEAY